MGFRLVKSLSIRFERHSFERHSIGIPFQDGTIAFRVENPFCQSAATQAAVSKIACRESGVDLHKNRPGSVRFWNDQIKPNIAVQSYNRRTRSLDKMLDLLCVNVFCG